MLEAVVQRSFAEILRLVEHDLGEAAFRVCFGAARVAGLQRGSLVIVAPSPMIRDWIRERHLGVVARRAAEVLGTPVRVRVLLDPAAGPGSESLGTALERALEGARPETRTKGILSGFRVVQENDLACRAVRHAVAGEGSGSDPLVVVGGPGSGKTMLLGAFRGLETSREPGRDPRVLLLGADEFTRRFTTAIKRRRTEALRESFEEQDAIVIDDVHRLAGRRSTQQELVHRIPGWLQLGIRLAFSSRSRPEDVKDLDPRLASILRSGLLVEIPRISDASLAILSGHRVGPDRIEIDRGVVALLAEGCRGNLRELQARLLRAVGLASACGRELTPAFAREHRVDIAGAPPRMREDLVLEGICAHFGVDLAGLRSSRKTRSLTLPRAVAAWVLRDRLELSWAAIGRVLGGRAHSSVHDLVRRHRPALETDPRLVALAERLQSESWSGAPS